MFYPLQFFEFFGSFILTTLQRPVLPAFLLNSDALTKSVFLNINKLHQNSGMPELYGCFPF